MKSFKNCNSPTCFGQLLHTFLKQLDQGFQVPSPQESCNSPSTSGNQHDEEVAFYTFFSSIFEKSENNVRIVAWNHTLDRQVEGNTSKPMYQFLSLKRDVRKIGDDSVGLTNVPIQVQFFQIQKYFFYSGVFCSCINLVSHLTHYSCLVLAGRFGKSALHSKTT